MFSTAFGDLPREQTTHVSPSVIVTCAVASALLSSISTQVHAQQPPPPAADHPSEQRSTGLPAKVDWTFNLDAAWGMFGFANSLYRDVRPDPSGNLDDNWFEGYAKPALSGSSLVDDLLDVARITRGRIVLRHERVDGENLSDRRDPVAESELGDAQYYRLPARSFLASVRFGF